MPIPPSSPHDGRQNLRGVALMVAAMFIFTLEATVIRALEGQVQTIQAVLFRAIGQFIIVFAWAGWRGAWPRLRTERLWLHIARGLVSIVGWWAYYLTFQKLDVGLATLLTFASSLFVVVLAGPVLGERVSPASWIATITGFIGIGIASDIFGQTIDPYVWVGLLSAALSAAIVFLTRALAQSEDTVTIMAWIGVFVLPAAAGVAALDWQPIAVRHMAILLLAGTFGALGMVLMIEAYAVAEAGLLAPIPYVRIGFAIGLGYMLFGERPTTAMLIGTAVVIASALYAMRAARR